jgi:hypothetical protein
LGLLLTTSKSLDLGDSQTSHNLWILTFQQVIRWVKVFLGPATKPKLN